MGGGLMIVASTLGGRVLVPLMQLVAQWRQIVNARQSYHRLDALLSSNADRAPPMQLPAPGGQLAAESMRLGAFDYLYKPVGEEQLLHTLERALAGRASP